MRSPGATFDLRAALCEEIGGAITALNAAPTKPKAVHRARVHLKRARALSRVGRACAPGLSKVFNDTARTVMRGLAQARDLAALSGAARDLAERSRRKSAAALNAIAEQLDAQRSALPPLNLEAARKGLADLIALAQVWPEASARQIERGANRVALRARRACDRGFKSDAPLRRHEWRKREKDRLYAATLLESAWPDQYRRRIKRGERLGEALGRERDILLLIQRLEAEPSIAGSLQQAERALATLNARRLALASRADRLGERLHRGGA